ncbi:P-loop NTPase family protein [Caldinitratiruptor microaerophilus]|uniref:Uncharacterized protein n=1 Tax=Caldinitratiruptor microaerophilus TaxID=671077 RepID=A0AA35CJY6_9FIRM|nr:hypothetical protein [Caldinitratiruptor microaerophilus]BDG59768.1 hypothetical protein caldi_08580 [Caldinitratiruptor microaerophilus]
MLVAALLSPATAEVLEAVRPLGEVAWVSVRQRDAAATQADFEAAARAAADVLLLDAGAGPPEALLAGARQYRVARPDSRVVLLAPGRLPGDPVVAGMVAIGVYDILAPDEAPGWESLLRDALTGPPATYAHAARWDAAHPGVGQPRAAPERVRVVERVQRVPLGGRPVVLAVVAAAPGAGATHTALAVAGYLARHGYRVGLVELCPRPALAWLLRSLSRDPGTGPDGVCLVPGVTVYALPIPAAGEPAHLPDAAQRLAPLLQDRSRHEYLVLDLGASPPDDPELARADLGIVILSPAPWRLREALRWTEGSAPSHWRFALTPATSPPEPFANLGAALHPLPWVPPSALPGYEHADPALDAALQALLEPVLLRSQARPGRSIAALLPAVSGLWRRLRPVLLPVALVYLAAAWARLALVSGPADRPPAWAAPGAAILRIFGLVD